MPSGPLLLPLVIASALLMENIDSTVIATSLPAIAVDLGVSPINLKLAFTSYLLTLAVLIPISGWCADRFGSRTVFRAAIGVFTLGSIACGFTNTLFGFVAARALQGAGGAMMVPVGRLIILRTVPKSDLVRALTYLTMPALIGPVFGPMLGGFITTYFHWRWIFWINVPIGFLGIALATRFIPDLREDNRPPLDLVGFVLSGLGLSMLVFGLTAAGGQVMPTLPDAGLIVMGAVLMCLYVRHAAHHDVPILDLHLLSLRTYRTSLVGGFFFRAGVGAIPFVLPMMLQVGFGLTPFESGSLTFASAAGALCMKFTAGPILRRLGFRNVLVSNTIISAVFLAVSALFTAATPHLLIFAVLLVGGFFRSLQFTSLNAIAYADVPQAAMSRASSFSSVSQQLSGSVGIAFAALVLQGMQALRQDHVIHIDDFRVAFVLVALLSASSILMNIRLPRDAGNEVSGYAPAPAGRRLASRQGTLNR
ncbi:MAG: DHA2 family efflux MFS transporter permease subunit [Hyphomicrobiales bacterium]|nr:DHA2 family efflux MFS transporter permease subunit [Hyphomicrobiales bacterium]